MEFSAIKPSICFVALNAYGALASIDTGHIDGIERQQSLMALWLAQNGYPVSMVTWEEGQDDTVDVEGVKVFKICKTEGSTCKTERSNLGLPLTQMFYLKYTYMHRHYS